MKKEDKTFPYYYASILTDIHRGRSNIPTSRRRKCIKIYKILVGILMNASLLGTVSLMLFSTMSLKEIVKYGFDYSTKTKIRSRWLSEMSHEDKVLLRDISVNLHDECILEGFTERAERIRDFTRELLLDLGLRDFSCL